MCEVLKKDLSATPLPLPRQRLGWRTGPCGQVFQGTGMSSSHLNTIRIGGGSCVHMSTVSCLCAGSNCTVLPGGGGLAGPLQDSGVGGQGWGDRLQEGNGEAGSRIKGQCPGPQSLDCGAGEWVLITTDRGIILSACGGCGKAGSRERPSRWQGCSEAETTVLGMGEGGEEITSVGPREPATALPASQPAEGVWRHLSFSSVSMSQRASWRLVPHLSQAPTGYTVCAAQCWLWGHRCE